MSFKETTGDHYNCSCPHCGKLNHDITRGVVVPSGKFTVFSRPCFHCGQPIFYTAKWEIAITASTEPLLEAQSYMAHKLAADPKLAAVCDEVASAD